MKLLKFHGLKSKNFIQLLPTYNRVFGKLF